MNPCEPQLWQSYSNYSWDVVHLSTQNVYWNKDAKNFQTSHTKKQQDKVSTYQQPLVLCCSHRICPCPYGKGWYVSLWQCAPDISRSPNNSRKTTIARPNGRAMGLFRDFNVSPKFYLRSCCALCNIELYRTAIYRESVVFHINWGATLSY